MSENKETMSAFVLEAPGKLIWEKRAIPVPEPGEALIRTRIVGICGSDIHAYHGRQPDMHYPGVLGHEILGEVVILNEPLLGKRQSTIKCGDRVVVDPVKVCGKCSACTIGRCNVCDNLKVTSVHMDGAFSEYFIVEVKQLYKVPDNVSDEKAVMAEPLSIAAQAINRGRIGKQDDAVVFGAGPIGICTCALAKNAGARVAVIDLHANRLSAAKSIGADAVIDGGLSEEKISQQIQLFCRENAPQVVIDAVGIKKTAQLSVECVARAGRLIILGMAAPDVGVPYLRILKKELDVLGSRLSKNRFYHVLEYLSENDMSSVLKDVLITNVYQFLRIEEAFSVAESSPERAIKVIVDFRL